MAIPAVWDETIVLPDSEIGELAAYARRAGDAWFLAAMCGPGPKSIQAPLSFLGEGDYRAELVRDPKDGSSSAAVPPGTVPPGTVIVERTAVRRGDTLTIEMGPGGGFLGRFSRD